MRRSFEMHWYHQSITATRILNSTTQGEDKDAIPLAYLSLRYDYAAPQSEYLWIAARSSGENVVLCMPNERISFSASNGGSTMIRLHYFQIRIQVGTSVLGSESSQLHQATPRGSTPKKYSLKQETLSQHLLKTREEEKLLACLVYVAI